MSSNYNTRTRVLVKMTGADFDNTIKLGAHSAPEDKSDPVHPGLLCDSYGQLWSSAKNGTCRPITKHAYLSSYVKDTSATAATSAWGPVVANYNIDTSSSLVTSPFEYNSFTGTWSMPAYSIWMVHAYLKAGTMSSLYTITVTVNGTTHMAQNFYPSAANPHCALFGVVINNSSGVVNGSITYGTKLAYIKRLIISRIGSIDSDHPIT